MSEIINDWLEKNNDIYELKMANGDLITLVPFEAEDAKTGVGRKVSPESTELIGKYTGGIGPKQLPQRTFNAEVRVQGKQWKAVKVVFTDPTIVWQTTNKKKKPSVYS